MGWLLLVAGLVSSGGVLLVWMVAARAVANESGAGHFLVPFTLGALLTLASLLALVLGGVVLLRRKRRDARPDADRVRGKTH